MGQLAILFPGQGAQTVGMGRDFADAFPAARKVFEQANQVLGFDVTKLCFEGPKEELDRTALCQPAILTTSMAIVAAMREAGHPALSNITAAAGLSLGEYSALVMTGALDFADALRLVQKRGQLMEDACKATPGAMVSVLGLDDEVVEGICAEARSQGMVVPANYNSPGQVVISGEPDAVARAVELAKAQGAKRCMPLAVSGAFHSPLMEPAALRLQEELEGIRIAKPKMTFIANVTADSVSAPAQIRESLARQVKSPVLWTQSIRRLVQEGVTEYIEVGPGKVLSGLLKRIAPECTIESIATAEALRPVSAG